MSSTILGINAQVDFGNLVVGLGTFCLALVTAIVALRSARSSSRDKLSEFRKEQIENLRAQIAEFHSVQCQLGVMAYGKSKGFGFEHSDFSDLTEKSQSLRSNIKLLLDHNKVTHAGLEEIIDQCHRLSLDKFKRDFKGKFIDEDSLRPLIDKARAVLKDEEKNLYQP
ncbi:hypothetical protein [Bosea minatitlanensis]|uniref:Uncharacterized protein n=1 Tax=Bosea minatitlanensis TaxID=128782 RepID=A0ABW0EXV7_9HYPH|nr:hypothetical protein [Bosea minatitlanensis]MCT4491958.1 hypothetical protein [Bosea minatitlanensis]